MALSINLKNNLIRVLELLIQQGDFALQAIDCAHQFELPLEPRLALPLQLTPKLFELGKVRQFESID